MTDRADIPKLLTLTGAVTSTLNLQEVVQASLDHTVHLFSAAAGDIALTGLPGQTRFVWRRQDQAEELLHHCGVEAPRLNREIASKAAKTGKPLVFPGAEIAKTGFGAPPGIASLVVIPLVGRGRVLGVMTLGCARGSRVEETRSDILASIGAITGAAIENSRAYLRLKRVSDTDSLTGLYNRGFIMDKFEHEIRRARRYGHNLSVAMADMCAFKGLNDKYGHLFGDLVLRKTAVALSSTFRTTDFIGRFGGDEFIILMPETQRVEAERVASRAQTRISHLRVKAPGAVGRFVSVSAQFGTAEFPPAGQTARELIDAADKQLYAAKKTGAFDVPNTAMTGTSPDLMEPV